MLYKTPRRKIVLERRTVYVSAEFGEHVIGNQAPYLSVTGEEWTGPTTTHERDMLSCGQLGALVTRVFPELAPVRALHLVSAPGEPMHYIANAKYWHDARHGVIPSRTYDPHPEDAFGATIHYGVVPESLSLGALIALPWTECCTYLEARRPALQAQYAQVVASLPELARALDAKPVRD